MGAGRQQAACLQLTEDVKWDAPLAWKRGRLVHCFVEMGRQVISHMSTTKPCCLGVTLKTLAGPDLGPSPSGWIF